MSIHLSTTVFTGLPTNLVNSHWQLSHHTEAVFLIKQSEMEPSFALIHDVIQPTSAFSTRYRSRAQSGREQNDQDCSADWDCSQTNPKNRIDSLEEPVPCLWRLDGAAGLGTQFFVVPLFLPEPVPMRLDVFIDEGSLHSPLIRNTLDLDEAFHIKDRHRLRKLGISKHILRILHSETLRTDGEIGRAHV